MAHFVPPPYSTDSMPDTLQASIYEAIAGVRLVDPHTHINPHSPASNTLADLLGYHYYTELAHAAGMPKAEIEDASLSPRELVGRLVTGLGPIENTAQYSWLIEICRVFFGFEGDRIDSSNWESLYDASERHMASADWPRTVLDQSNVEAVFLTNDFDDPLEGFDTNTYIPCLRADDLVFHLAKPETQQRLAACTGIELDGSLSNLRRSLEHRFEHFVAAGARACAISLPPSFEPAPVGDGRAEVALDHVLGRDLLADEAHRAALSRRVFWTIAELCDEYGLPFDLMIGVNRGVYPAGVHQGQDLYDSRVSLIQYRELFNALPNVKFPISVLASVTNQELVSYAWIFPNVITNGHWWYSNTPSFIARDAAARLEAVPQTKQIGYYSDAYKLEFVWPKFDMYRMVLSRILAEQFVRDAGWSEHRAIELGRQVLRENVDAIFPKPTRETELSSGERASATSVETAAALPPGADNEPDPLPSAEELKSLGIADVELTDTPAGRAASDVESIANDLDHEPLDVGDLLAESDDATDLASRGNDVESIRMLRGETSFTPDEDSLQLRPDPATGEFRMPYPEEENEPEAPPQEGDPRSKDDEPKD